MVPKHRGGWRLIIDLRYVPQFRHGITTFQNGGPVYAAQHGESGMAYGKTRPKRRILDHPYCPRVLESSYFSTWPSTSTDAVTVSPIWALHRSICLFKGHKANNPTPTPVRNPSDNLIRRSATGSTIQGAIAGEFFNCNMAFQQFGVPDKYPKVRICSGIRSNDSIPSNAQDLHRYEKCYPPFSERIDASERPGWSHWDISSNLASGMDWAPSLLCPTRLEDTSTPSAPILLDIDKPVTRGENRSSVVALRPESHLLSNDFETRSLDSHRVRRLDIRLGSCLPWSNNWWQMDIRRGWFTHQLVRAPNDFSGFAILFEGQDQLVGFGQIRQSHCYSLLEQDGQPHKIPACWLALEIWEWCFPRQISPHAEYLAGKDSVLADWESRHHDNSDWQLLPSVFEAVHHLLGLFTIDLFASRTNTQLPIYCSWRPDPQARVVDAFSTS